MKKDILKVMACAMLLLTIPASAVYAGTHSVKEKKRGIGNYVHTYAGSVGSYTAAYENEFARTSVVNTTSTGKYIYVASYRYNYATNVSERKDEFSDVLGAGVSTTTFTYRNPSNDIVDYYHVGIGHASSSVTSHVLDRFTYIAQQYYEY